MGTKVYDNYADLITFNRNSKGTALRPIGYGDELVTNGTFDTDTTGWEVRQPYGSISVVSGECFTDNGPSGGYSGPNQALSVVTGRVYLATAKVRRGTGSERMFLTVGPTKGSNTWGSLETSLSGDQYLSLVFVAQGTTANVSVAVGNDAEDEGYCDNISVKEVLFDREGDPLTLFLHPEGVPRIEYDADRNLKGLLIEPDGQNKCLQSEDITTTWLLSQATRTANVTTAPDGNSTADRLVDDDGGGTGEVVVYQTIAVSAGTKYTFSVFLKADQLAFARIEAQFPTATSKGQFFGLSGAGTKGTALDLDDSKIEAYPNGWYRCSITWTQPAGQAFVYTVIQPADSISNSDVDRDDSSSIFVWGAQLETGPIATSYMPTTISPFTRGKDEATMTNVSGLIGQKEGTLYIEVDWREAGPTSQLLLELSDGTYNNRILIFNSSTNIYMYAQADGGSVEVFEGVSSSGFSGIQKIAFAYKTNDFELYRNGSSIRSSTSGSLAALATLTNIDLGQDSIATVQANMWIRAIQIIPRRLSDEQLIELTS